MASRYTVVANGALTGGVARTVADLITGATRPTIITAAHISFDGVTASAVPGVVDFCTSTQATAGTTTAFTPVLVRGQTSDVALATAGINYTAEPTVLGVAYTWFVSPLTGLVIPYPLGREPEGVSAASTARKGWALRLNFAAAVNYRAVIEFEEG